MASLLILACFESSTANFGKKTSTKLVKLLGISEKALSAFK